MLATQERQAPPGDGRPGASPPPPERAADARLAARLVAGDETALAAIYDQHSALVFGLARRVTCSASAAEDITQEVFSHLWERPERYDPAKGSLRAFLGVLSHRRAVDWVRREEAGRRRAEREFHLDARDHAHHDADGESFDTAARVRLAVAALPADQREAVMLAYFGGLTYREVATRLRIPEGTAKSRLRLALAKLGTALSAQGITAWT